MAHSKSGPIAFLFENSLFLVAGAVGALVWANVDASRETHTYKNFINYDLAGLFSDEHPSGGAHSGHGDAKHDSAKHDDGKHDSAKHDSDKGDSDKGDSDKGDSDKTDGGKEGSDAAAAPPADGGHHGFTIFFLVNDILMALFFAIAGKEVWEAMLPGGALSNPRKAATPLLATLGGVIGPAAVYLIGVAVTGRSEYTDGWAIPCATDIAFSYLIARVVFGPGHPAIAFLLLLAIADDAAGLVILAVFYPIKDIVPAWFLLSAGAVALGFGFRRMRLQSFWWYLLIPGSMCWLSFYFAGLHPALGLVPIIPCFPHAHTDLGIFAREELHRDDTLNAFEHWWKNPVELILGMFGLCNAGVAFGAIGVGTWLVLLGLMVGKPVGITLFTYIAEKWFKLEMPAGMSYRHIVSLGMIAAIGFTVALFVSTAAFPGGEIQNSVKMGALLSLGAAVAAVILARALGIKPLRPSEAPAGGGASPGDSKKQDGHEGAALASAEAAH